MHVLSLSIARTVTRSCRWCDVVDMDSTGNGTPHTISGVSKSDVEAHSYGSNTKVDSVHPRFLHPKERPPLSTAASTDDFFCEQCKIMFPGSVDGIQRHFISITHAARASCRYCGGEVYEYLEGDRKKLAHDCSPDRKGKKRIS